MKRIESIKSFLKSRSIIFQFIIFSTGFVIGYYIASLVQKQTGIFGIPAIIIAVFGGLGAALALSNTIINWFKSEKEKETLVVKRNFLFLIKQNR